MGVMKKIVRDLDKISSSLEEKGYIKEAAEIDIISNTIERMMKESWIAHQSPQYFTLESVKRALRMKKIDVALALLENNAKGKNMILNSYGDYKNDKGVYPAWEYADSYSKSIDYLKKNNIEGALREIERAQQALIDLEPIITERQTRVVKRGPDKIDMGEMIFTKGKKPLIKNKGEEGLFFGPAQQQTQQRVQQQTQQRRNIFR